MKFKSFGLKNELLQGIENHGFKKPSEIQKFAIKHIINGQDVMAQARSGSGKTAAFSIGLLQNVNAAARVTQAIVLAPTRELAQQINHVIHSLGEFLHLQCALFIGGANSSALIGSSLSQPHTETSTYQYDDAIIDCSSTSQKKRRKLDKNNTLAASTSLSSSASSFVTSSSPPQIVIGTPGRVLDLITHDVIRVNHVRMFVLDEVDEMIASGLMTQLCHIYRALPAQPIIASSSPTASTAGGDDATPSSLQVVVLSATMPRECRQLMRALLTAPKRILLDSSELRVRSLRHYYVVTPAGLDQKYATLLDIYANVAQSRRHQTVIFANSRAQVEAVHRRLTAEGYATRAVHKAVTQREREAVMREFRSGAVRLLVCTDIWARGIDVHAVNLVINFDLPRSKTQTNGFRFNSEVYFHRVGRGGRFGRKGLAISFVLEEERACVKSLREKFQVKMRAMPQDIQRVMRLVE